MSSESGRYHMVGVAPEACCAGVNTHTTHQGVSELCTPTQLVGTRIVTLLGQWGLRRTRNGRRTLGMELH